MCEYSNDASSSLDCLDVIDDLFFVGRTCERAILPKSHATETFDNESEQVDLERQQDPSGRGQSRLDTEEEEEEEKKEKEALSVIAVAAETGGCKLEDPSPHRGPLLIKNKLVASPDDQMSRRKDNLITCMLITANVGTIFEESTLLELWFQQLKSYLSRIKPQLVAIHCQEVGGKNFETSMKNVSSFTDKILDDQAIVGDYSRVRIFLDENFECLEKFTALGSLYLIHDSVDDVELFNFKTAQYDVIGGRKIFAVSDHNDPTNLDTSIPEAASQKFKHEKSLAEQVEKIKFPLSLFPECRWSRKGFMRTRWRINGGQPLDLVNIHLFHDASNLVAMKATPSPYAQNRQQALEYALDWLSKPLKSHCNNNNTNNNNNNIGSDLASHTHSRESYQVPLFIFGDFNFRLDTHKVVQRITEGASPIIKRSADSNEVLEFVYHRKTSSVTKPGPDCEESRVVVGSEGNNWSKNNHEVRDRIDCDATHRVDDGNSNYIEDGGVVMTVGKKLFDCENLDEMFRATKNTEWLLELDTELDRFKDELYEFKISFSPSYPFKEDETGGHSYMKTRCPAWCDRILFNAAANRIVQSKGELLVDKVSEDGANPDSEMKIEQLKARGDVIYRLMGNSVPMGDHKPVLLYCQLDLSTLPFSSTDSNESEKVESNAATYATGVVPSNLLGSKAT